MKEWFTCAELAGLPGLPTTALNIRKRAARESWPGRARAGRGGGREYPLGCLPAEARTALLLRERRSGRAAEAEAGEEEATVGRARREELWRLYERRPAGVKAEAERRLDAVLLVERLMADGERKLAACALVARELGRSESTVRGWMHKVRGAPRGDYLPLLAPGYVGRTAFREYEPQIYQLFRDLYLAPEKRGYARCWRDVKEIADHEGWSMPHLSTLMRDVERKEDPRVVKMEREGPEALARMTPYVERDSTGFRAMEALNMDGHNLDLAVRWPDGETCRITLITTQDLYSRRIVGWRIAKAESAYEVQLAFLGVSEEWGLCSEIYVDNTLSMASKRMTAGMPGRHRFKDREGDEEGLLKQLNVRLHWVKPAHGQSKPIERAFRDLREAISQNPLLSGAYLGNTPLAKPHNYGTRVVSVAEVRAVVADEIYRHNHQAKRTTPVCGGRRSFEEVFQASYAAHQGEIGRLTASQRRILYLMSDVVRADRNSGTVTLLKNRYWAPEMNALAGRQVVVRYHPDDLHGSVYVYALDGKLLAEAACLERRGFADKASAVEQARLLGQNRRLTKKLAQVQRRMSPAEVMRLRPALPVEGSAAEVPREVARMAPAVPASIEKILTIPSAREREAAQRRVFDGLSALDDALQRRMEERLAG